MQQPTIIRQPIYGGTRVSLRDQRGAETDLGEIRAVPRQPGWWQLADRNGRRLGTVPGDIADVERLLIAATAIDH
jgi:hypothetical protein